MAFGARLKGVLAICQPKQYQLENLKLKQNPFIVILEGVEKPGNIGTVIRTADGAGVDAVILCNSKTDVYNHNIVRSSIGTIFTVPTIMVTPEETLQFLKSQNIKIFTTSANTEKLYTTINFKQPSAIIIGNEHTGVSSFWEEHAEAKIKISMLGEASSLNAAMSASIIIYEALRQKMS
ncbi:hypothetical protein MNBD_UNCLBAC01-376 [hydrothermal vent metagenome]|uniref:tRNA/rRNA methyltransferase SpoU type domain-containing protein n=1 Tax=hydrothermal vent metagenome TaxID=652676 RepID=A0A3B1D3Q6_9ZZZZ